MTMTNSQPYSRWTISILLGGLLVPSLIYLFLGGRVSGVEFSPDDFSRRQFSYNVMPIFRIPISGRRFNDVTPVFEQTLILNGFIDRGNPNPHWDLVSDSRTHRQSPDFDAQYLCRMLDLSGNQKTMVKSFWQTWNDEHPVLATQFWPLVAELARQGLYLDAASIMLNASELSSTSSDDWGPVLNRSVAESFRLWGIRLVADGEFDQAIRILTRSIEIFPTGQAYRDRARCYLLQGNAELGEQDLETATLLVEN